MAADEKGGAGMAVYLAMMIALGAVVFAGFGWLVEERQGRPITIPDGPAGANVAMDGLPALIAGAQTAVDAAAAHLEQGSRADAVHALDAAMRATEVAKHVADGAAKRHVEEASKHIMGARHQLQIGRVSGAIERLQEAANALSQAAAANPSNAVKPPDATTWPAYEDAVLLNRYGVRIGEIIRITSSPEDGAQAVLAVGGAPEVFGLFDIGGRTTSVAADRLLFGKLKTLGNVHVVLPTDQLPE